MTSSFDHQFIRITDSAPRMRKTINPPIKTLVEVLPSSSNQDHAFNEDQDHPKEKTHHHKKSHHKHDKKKVTTPSDAFIRNQHVQPLALTSTSHHENQPFIQPLMHQQPFMQQLPHNIVQNVGHNMLQQSPQDPSRHMLYGHTSRDQSLTLFKHKLDPSIELVDLASRVTTLEAEKKHQDDANKAQLDKAFDNVTRTINKTIESKNDGLRKELQDKIEDLKNDLQQRNDNLKKDVQDKNESFQKEYKKIQLDIRQGIEEFRKEFKNETIQFLSEYHKQKELLQGEIRHAIQTIRNLDKTYEVKELLPFVNSSSSLNSSSSSSRLCSSVVSSSSSLQLSLPKISVAEIISTQDILEKRLQTLEIKMNHLQQEDNRSLKIFRFLLAVFIIFILVKFVSVVSNSDIVSF